MHAGGQSCDGMDQGRVEEVSREPHVRYAALLMSQFSHIAPRLVHAPGFPVMGASFACPEYDSATRSFLINRFFQTGFFVVPGT